MIRTLALTLLLGVDPSIASSKAVFTEVDAAVKAKTLTHAESSDCEQELSSFETWTDAKGVVRLSVWEFGSEDSSHRAERYFDAKGRLRFLFIKVGAVPDAHVEARFSFDEKGKVVKKARKVWGEGYGGYANDPGEYLKMPAHCDAG